MKNKVEGYLQTATPEEKEELELIYNAMVKNANICQADASEKNLKSWRFAQQTLKDVLEDLDEKYGAKKEEQQEQEAIPAPQEPYTETKNAMDVLRWLQSAGYQKEKTQLYDDINDGKLKKNRHGVFTKRLVKKYAQLIPRLATGKTEAEEKIDLGQQKQKQEVEKLELHNERARFEFDLEKGKYSLTEDFDRELAARLVVLDSGLERLFRDAAPKIIHISGGNQKNIEQLVDFLTTEKNKMLNSYATTKTYQVLIMPKKTEEDVQ